MALGGPRIASVDMYARWLLLMAATVSKAEGGKMSRWRPFFPRGGMNACYRSFLPFPHYGFTFIHTASRVASGYKIHERRSRQHTYSLAHSKHASSPPHHLRS
jgi:hypothetical protein